MKNNKCAALVASLLELARHYALLVKIQTSLQLNNNVSRNAGRSVPGGRDSDDKCALSARLHFILVRGAASNRFKAGSLKVMKQQNRLLHTRCRC